MKKSDLLIFKGYELEKIKIEKAETFKEDGNFSINLYDNYWVVQYIFVCNIKGK